MKVQIHSFLTSALDVGEWLTPRPGRFTSDKKDPLSVVQKDGWAPWLVWTGIKNTKSLAPSRVRTQNGPVRSDLLYRLRYAYSQGIPTLSERRISFNTDIGSTTGRKVGPLGPQRELTVSVKELRSQSAFRG